VYFNSRWLRHKLRNRIALNFQMHMVNLDACYFISSKVHWRWKLLTIGYNSMLVTHNAGAILEMFGGSLPPSLSKLRLLKTSPIPNVMQLSYESSWSANNLGPSSPNMFLVIDISYQWSIALWIVVSQTISLLHVRKEASNFIVNLPMLFVFREPTNFVNKSLLCHLLLTF